MKNIITILIAFFATLQMFAQAPEKMSYQAVVRNSSDDLITDTTIGMQISILEGSSTGTAIYVETHTPTTNANGLASLEVGMGTVITGDMSTIAWGEDSYFIKTETDPTGGSSYSIEGTSQLLSVPYALFAKNGGSGNTLDGAYDQSGTGSPTTRTINADDGKIEIIALGNDALELTPDATNRGIKINNAGLGDGILIENIGDGKGINVLSASPDDAISITNAAAGAGLKVTNDGGGDAIDIISEGGGDALTIDNAGLGNALFIDNLDSAGSIAVSVSNDGGSHAVDILNDGGGLAVNIDNTGGGDAVNILQTGDGDAVEIDNDGDGVALKIDNAHNAAGEDAVNILNDGGGDALRILNESDGTGIKLLNAGDGVGLEITNDVMLFGGDNSSNKSNGAPKESVLITHGGPAKAVYIDNTGTNIGVQLFNSNPANTKPTVLASNGGKGIVAEFVTDDINTNTESTLVTNNQGNGRAAEFVTTDQETGKVNDKPTVDVRSNGKGIGVNVHILNDVFGADSNTESALKAVHEGYGNAGYFRTPSKINISNTVEIENHGRGHALHLDSYDGTEADIKSTLYAEQGNSVTVSDKGRVAVFDLHPTDTSTDAAVLIRSGATSAAHSALRVIRADPTKLAGVFEGDVEISTDLTVGGAFAAAAKAFKIDHPLDPEHKFLIHNSIESNERLNIYSGNTTTNDQGYATVILPSYMSALNKDFKYQLTIVDKSFAQAIIWEEVNTKDNSFVIKTNQPTITVSWQITGTRQDTWALENPMQVEVDKNADF